MDPPPIEPEAPRNSGQSAPLSGRVLVDRYRLGKRLGCGDLGDVFAADDLLRLSIADEAQVAVKVFHPSVVDSSGGVRALAPKLATACRLSHPHVVNAYDFYEDGNHLLLAMERLEGRTLEQKLEASNGAPPLSFEASDAILRQLIDALRYLHTTTSDPVLRLHPRRIWIEEEPRGVCIADLALSSLITPSILRQSAISSGSSAYVAPEVFSATGTPDLRADQFSLGVLALALFTGSTAASVTELRRRLGPAGGAWIKLLPRLLAPDPDHRFGDLSEVAVHLDPSTDTAPPRRFLLRRAQRNENPPSRWPLLSFPRLALIGVIILIVAALAWRLTPEVMANRQAHSEASGELDEAHRRLLAVDNLRIDLLSKGLDQAEFRAQIQRLVGARADIDLATALGRASEQLKNDAITASAIEISSLLVTLKEREEAFRTAAAVINACDQLTTLREAANGMEAAAQLPQPGKAEVIDAAREVAVRQFDEGNFEAALVTARSAANGARAAFRSAAMSLRTEALEARQEWHQALAALGDFPEIEPVGVPADWLRSGDAAIERADWTAAAASLGPVRARYAGWTTSLQGIDNHETGAGSFTNSLGMRFVRVDDLLASVWETRLIDYLAFTHATGADAAYQWREFAETTDQGPLHPAVNINLADGVRFCQWLTGRERRSGAIAKDQEYRIPADLEWSTLAGIEDDPAKTPRERSFAHPDAFPWGNPKRTANSGNYATWPNRHLEHRFKESQDPYRETAPVGSFPANANGLHDLGGNVWEWTTDTHFGEKHAQNRVIRGGGWKTFSPDAMRTAFRDGIVHANQEVGFRVVLTPRLKVASPAAAGTTTNVLSEEKGGGDAER